MRHLHSFLYFIGVGALIAGVTDSIAIALGGSAGNHLLAIGFVLLSIGNGLRFNGAGHTPPRASFLLLGLAGALPLFAGMAPLSAAFGAMFFLPLRALGANLGAAAASHKFNKGLLLFGTLIGANVIPGIAVGIPGFICVWALTGILQRYYLINSKDDVSTQPMNMNESLVPFTGGVAIAMLVLLFLPYATVFDYATTADNTIRGNTMLFLFAVSWFTLAAGLADTMATSALRISSAILAVTAVYSLGFIEKLSTPETYGGFFQDPRILNLANADTLMLSEENPLYVPLITSFCFAIPLALAAVFLRSIIRDRKQLAATISGFAAAFIIIAIAPRDIALSSRLALTVAAFIATLLFSFKLFNSNKYVVISVAALTTITCLLLPVTQWQPTVHLAARGNFTWQATDGSTSAKLTHVDRNLITTHQDQNHSVYFDGRSAITPLPNSLKSYNQSDAFIKSLSAENDTPILISKPEQLINSAGNHSLIKLYASAQYNSRRSLLRHELFRQASMRLNENGLCVLRIASDELAPNVAPQIAQSFNDIFADSKVFIFSDTLEIPYLIFVGSNQPIAINDNARSIEITLAAHTNVDTWLLQGPWRPVDVLMANNRPLLNPKVSLYHRAGTVLSELASHQAQGSHSLLGFYAAHLQAQEYSVHDTYLQDNPLATETTSDALEKLLAVTKSHPNSDYLHQLWRNVGLVLVESREITWISTYFGSLRQLGWEDDFVLLSLAHAALESLNFEAASTLCVTILERYPQHIAASAVLELARNEQQVPRDGHMGHDH
jgi:hypothetical protein